MVGSNLGYIQLFNYERLAPICAAEAEAEINQHHVQCVQTYTQPLADRSTPCEPWWRPFPEQARTRATPA